MARLGALTKKFDRFAKWAPGAALLVLAGFALLLIAAALSARPVPNRASGNAVASAATALTTDAGGTDEDTARDASLKLYERVAERVGAGENYYVAAIEEQRARDIPVRPGVAVRLPTLAWISGHIGPWGMMALAFVLGVAVFIAWWDRLENEPGGRDYRTSILLLVAIGALAGFKPHYLALHEVWAGMFVALSLGLYRPGQWGWALVFAAAALALRELALPYVCLMGAVALLRGERAEAVAWGLVAGLFLIGLAAHASLVGALTGTADPVSPGWLALRGLGGWTGNIVASSPLQLLPAWLAAPLALLPLIGWAGWRSDLGQTGLLLCLGYGLGFMIFGRDNNFYWALVVMPIWFVGLAFVPRALSSLWASARGQ
ncbi:hypothetical protein [Aurantiacibacter suaedae]|uniref:hypothetical protein n=1 Tax=Aurantiacibacter suaedae TaxID=2545755 RepID=UPI0010F467C5|nr:hypothetical protein [Aurantiacibacter suaedae]